MIQNLLWKKENFRTYSYIGSSRFPRSEEVPEGCIVLEDLKDEWGCQVDFIRMLYMPRESRKTGTWIGELHTENAHSGAYCSCWSAGEEKKKKRKWPCIVYIQGSAFHKQWLWDHISRHIRMAEHGYVVAIVGVPSFGDGSFSRSDAGRKTAVRFLKKHCEDTILT